MAWSDVCSWASCLGKRKEEADDMMAPRPVFKLAHNAGYQEISEKKSANPLQSFPQPPSIASEQRQLHSRRERDLPRAPPIPVYEIGFSSPRTGVTRSNSKSSIRTATSTRSRKRDTQNFEKQTKPAVGLRRPSQRHRKSPAPEQQAVELDSPSSPHSLQIPQHPESSITQQRGKVSPFPQSARSASTKVKRDDESLVACDEEKLEERSLRDLRRRSESAPIPLKRSLLGGSLRSNHTIRRKPVTPKPSGTFLQRSSRESLQEGTFAQHLNTSADPVEMDVPAFELSADPQSRAQSYYADIGIFLLTETLDKAPPMPSLPPSLAVDTSVRQQNPALDANTSKRFTFSPMTTVSSPIEDANVSPITLPMYESSSKMAFMKRSKSMGSLPPLRLSISIKPKPTNNEEKPLPSTLPISVYSPLNLSQRSHANSLLKAELSEDSSHQPSDTSDKSDSSSRSSLPSRGPSPSYMDKVKIIKRRRKPEQDLETLKPIAFQRRSTNAPIPILSTDDIPSVPRLPPQAYHFTTAKDPVPHTTNGLLRSLSTKNLRTQEAAQNLPKLGRSKSIYHQVTAWNDSNTRLPSRLNQPLPPLPQHPASIPLPDSDAGSDLESEYDSDSDTEYGSAQLGATELDSHNHYLIETGPRSLLTTPVERQDPIEGAWGKGLGAAWGVAY